MASFKQQWRRRHNNNMRRNSSSDNSLIISPGNDDSNNNDSPVSPTNNMNENIAQMEDAGFIEWGDDAGVSSSAVDDVRVCLLCAFSSLYTLRCFGGCTYFYPRSCWLLCVDDRIIARLFSPPHPPCYITCINKFPSHSQHTHTHLAPFVFFSPPLHVIFRV